MREKLAKAERHVDLRPVEHKYAYDYRYKDVEICIMNGQEPEECFFAVGERLHFVQEPENKFDGRAVRVENKCSVKAGYMYKGRLQDMANDFVARNDAVVGEVTYYDGETMKATLYFYRGVSLDELEAAEEEESDVLSRIVEVERPVEEPEKKQTDKIGSFPVKPKKWYKRMSLICTIGVVIFLLNGLLVSGGWKIVNWALAVFEFYYARKYKSLIPLMPDEVEKDK